VARVERKREERLRAEGVWFDDDEEEDDEMMAASEEEAGETGANEK